MCAQECFSSMGSYTTLNVLKGGNMPFNCLTGPLQANTR
jgi:hypothetical protein